MLYALCACDLRAGWWLVAAAPCSALDTRAHSALSSFLDRARLLGFALRSARPIGCALPSHTLLCLLCVVCCVLCVCWCCARSLCLVLCAWLAFRRWLCVLLSIDADEGKCPAACHQPHEQTTTARHHKKRQIGATALPRAARFIVKQTANIGNGIRDVCE